MGEIASAYPTAGGLYYWASRMKSKNWGWWTAWLNLIGQFAIVAGINFAAALFINATIVTPLLSNVGIDYGNTTVLIGTADQPILVGSLLTMGILMLLQLVINIAGINLVALLNQVSVWWHIGIVAAVVVLVFLAGKPDESGLTLFAIQPQDVAGSWNNNLGFVNLQYGPAISYPLILAFFFSLLQANWTYTGYDASAHVAEETVGARKASAWGIFLSVAVSAVVGYIFLFTLSTHLPNLSTLFPNPLPDPLGLSSQYYFGDGAAVIDILIHNLGPTVGGVLSAGIAIAMWFCGLSAIASAGRMLFAFSRDDGVPGSGWLKKVSHRYRTPANSLTAIVVIAWLFSVAAFFVGPRGGGHHRHGDQHDLPVRRLRRRHLPGRDDPGLGQGTRLEPGPVVEADRLGGHRLDPRPDGPLQLPDVREHLVPVHGRRGPVPPRLLLRLGPASASRVRARWATRQS